MTTRIMSWWEDLRSTYWALPGGMTVLAAIMALALVEVDSHRSRDLADQAPWIYTGGADGARAILSAIAASTITVAGTTFSITIAALTLASSQFGPRLLRNFMRDTGNQIVLGTFIGTFLYCILVLRRVQSVEEVAFVPYISVTVAILLAIANIAVLIYFIDHAAASIQASHVIASASNELEHAIDRLFPEKLGTGNGLEEALPAAELQALTSATAPGRVPAPGSGYIRAIDNGGLMEAARGSSVVVRLDVKPGDFVFKDQTIAFAWPGDHISEESLRQIGHTFILGIQRTEEQDARFPIDQLVEVAVRALSPGINDPFTAMSCIDRLGQALHRLANRDFPSVYRRDHDGTIRVIAVPRTFEDFLDSACNQIRQYGASSVAVTIHLLDMLEKIGRSTSRTGVHEALVRQARLVRNGIEARAQADIDDVQRALDGVLEACGQPFDD